MADKPEQQYPFLNGQVKFEQAVQAAKDAGFDLGANAAVYFRAKSLSHNPNLTPEIGDMMSAGSAEILNKATANHNAAVDKLGLKTVQSLQERIATLCMEKNSLPYAPLHILDDANEHMTDINIVYGKPSVAENGNVILMQNNGVDFNATQDCSPSP